MSCDVIRNSSGGEEDYEACQQKQYGETDEKSRALPSYKHNHRRETCLYSLDG
jgi:hypothetical protein